MVLDVKYRAHPIRQVNNCYTVHRFHLWIAIQGDILVNLYHLRYFLAVARSGGFTPAAREHHVTQPTVSSGVAELERSLGVRLFHRTGRAVTLTMEGRTLIGYAQQIEDLILEAENRVRQPGVQPGVRIQFGAIDAAVIYLLPEILRTYTHDFPQVELSVQVAPSRYLVDDLLTSRSEFAVISLPFDEARLETRTLVDEAMPLVVGAGHRLAGRRSVTPDDVVQERLILFHGDSVSRRIVDERLAEAGASAQAVMEMRSPEAMRKLVQAGVGVSFLPRMTVEESLTSGVLVEVVVEGVELSRQIGLAWRRGRYFGPAIRHLLEAILARHGHPG